MARLFGSIRRKLLLSITVAMLLFAVCFTWIRFARTAQDLDGQIRRTLRNATDQKALQATLALQGAEMVAGPMAGALEA